MKILAAITLSALGLLCGCGSQALPRAFTPMETEAHRSAWNTAYAGGQQIRTSHYQIFTTTENRPLLDCLPGFLEGCRRNYRDLTSLPEAPQAEPMTVYLMGSREEWAALTSKVVGDQAQTYLSIGHGGYCHQGVCVFWDIGGLGTLAVAAHEGMHQFLHGRMKQQLPMWAEEGLSVLSEGYELRGREVAFGADYNPLRYSELRSAISSTQWIPLEKLLTMDGGDAVTGRKPGQMDSYYGQLWALLLFIRSGGWREGFGRMLADAEAGRLNEALGMDQARYGQFRAMGREYNRRASLPLFKHYIGGDMAAFERAYRSFAEKLVGIR